MNAWVRRSLQASLLAGGFVVLGAGIASASEPATALPDTGASADLVGTVTKTADDTVGAVTGKQAAATGSKALAEHVSGDERQDAAKKPARPARKIVVKKTLPAHDTVGAVTGQLTEATGGLLGKHASGAAGPRPLPAPEGTSRSVDLSTAQVLPYDNPTADVVGGLAATPSLGDDGLTGDVTGMLTATVDGTLDTVVDAGDLGHATSSSDLSGALDGVTELSADGDRLSGITSVSGVLDTATSFTGEIADLGGISGSSLNTSTLDGILALDGDLGEGRLYGFGALSSTLDSINTVDVWLGDDSYLTSTLDVFAWTDGIVEAAADLSEGDASGIAALAGTLDALATVDGQLGDHAALTGSLWVSALVDATVVVAADLTEGDVSGVGTLFAALDSTGHLHAFVDGLGHIDGSTAVTGGLDAVLEIVGDAS